MGAPTDKDTPSFWDSKGDIMERMERMERKRRERELLANRPPDAPDLTDQVIKAAQRAERDRLRTGRTRASTFLGGSADVSTTDATAMRGYRR